jgi:tetratricopeptide (TPR) repeat protein
MLGDFLLQAGHLREALDVYAKIIEEEPDYLQAYGSRAEVYKQQGDFAAAAAARAKAHALVGEQDAVRAFTDVTTESGYRQAERTVARAQLLQVEEVARTAYISPFVIARLHAQSGHGKQALDWLEKAAKDDRHVGLMLLRVDPVWDSVHAEPRFYAVVRKLGIPP